MELTPEQTQEAASRLRRRVLPVWIGSLVAFGIMIPGLRKPLPDASTRDHIAMVVFWLSTLAVLALFRAFHRYVPQRMRDAPKPVSLRQAALVLTTSLAAFFYEVAVRDHYPVLSTLVLAVGFASSVAFVLFVVARVIVISKARA